MLARDGGAKLGVARVQAAKLSLEICIVAVIRIIRQLPEKADGLNARGRQQSWMRFESGNVKHFRTG